MGLPDSSGGPVPLLGLLAAAGALLGAAFPAAADDAPAVLRVTRHGAAVSADNPLIAEVRVSLTRPARVFVEYDNPQAGRYRTPLTAPDAEHVIPIVRLRPQTTYDYTIFVMDHPAAALRGRGRFTTGRLPARLAMPVKVSGRSSQPLILSNYRRGADFFSYFVYRDETGALVWYYHEPPPLRSRAFTRLPGGNLFSYEVRSSGSLTEITPLGEVVNRFERGGQWGIPHHEITVLDDGRVMYLSHKRHVFDDSVNGGAAATRFLVDNLRVYDPASGQVEQVWDAKEAWDVLDPDYRMVEPPRPKNYRWTIFNSASIGPRGNVILSSRQRHQVVSLSPDLRTVEWQLSGPNGDYRFPNPADRFYGQHTAAQLANGNILLFDNGVDRPDSEGGHYSRALELRLDDAAGTAVKAWEYRPEPDVYSIHSSSAYRLSNGNTLVNFGVRVRVDLPLLIVEADAAGNEVFRFESLPWFETERRLGHEFNSLLPDRYRTYGGIDSIMGETMLRPPAAAPMPQHAETVGDGFIAPVDPARVREIEAAMDGAQRVTGGPFDLYPAADRLVYRKQPCAPGDAGERFFLHVIPVDADDLPAGHRAHGFYNRSFWFVDYGLRWQGACLAAVPLPGYPIARIRTGQFTPDGQLWQAEFAGRAGAGE